jgi:hypothetical protein
MCVQRRSGADRAAQIARDTDPPAALSRDGAYAYTAPPAPPCAQISLTHSRAGAPPAHDPIRATVHLVAGKRRDRKDGET